MRKNRFLIKRDVVLGKVPAGESVYNYLKVKSELAGHPYETVKCWLWGHGSTEQSLTCQERAESFALAMGMALKEVFCELPI